VILQGFSKHEKRAMAKYIQIGTFEYNKEWKNTQKHLPAEEIRHFLFRRKLRIFESSKNEMKNKIDRELEKYKQKIYNCWK